MYDRGSDSAGVPPELRHLISPFPDVRERYPVHGSMRGLGATNVGASVATGATVGASVGTVVPVLGTAIGGAVGAIVGVVAGLFGGGGKDKTGLPQVPSLNTAFNVALATKWYTLYFTRYAPGGSSENSGTQASGIAYWANEIAHDGPQRAWANFSTSPQPVQDQVPAKAAAYAPIYGSQYVLAPPGAPATGAFTPTQVAGAPVGTVDVSQANVLGGMSSSTLLLVGGGLLVGFLLMRRKGAGGAA